MKFPKSLLQEVAYDDCPDGFEKIKDDIIEVSRWTVLHSMVFKFEGKFYQSSYHVGATEMQDESPYEYDGDKEGMVECIEVVQKEVLTKVWKAVEK